MAKKILAVVLAVMMAVSAMAISVAADNPTIDLYQTKTSKSSTITVEFTIPLYAQYGWGTQYDGFEITLPTNLGGAVSNKALNYYVMINGQQFNLKPVYENGKAPANAPDGTVEAAASQWDATAGTYTQKVFFGAFAHNYFMGKDKDGNLVDQWTTVPQTQTFGSTSSIKVCVDINYPDEWAQTWAVGNGFTYQNQYGKDVPYADAASFLKGVYGMSCYAQFITHEADGEYYPVEHSATYLIDWVPNVSGANNDPSNSTKQEFASGDLKFVIDNTSNGIFSGDVSVAHPLTWDHNLANRATILGAEADYAELVVELDKPLNGIATYTLYARSRDNGIYLLNNDLWWAYDDSRVLVDSQPINGKVDELRFKVPLDLLYDSVGYGTYNDEFVIFETVGLFNSTFMDSYFTTTTSSGSAAFLSWNVNSKMDPYSGKAWLNYNDEPVNYAAGGTAFPDKIDTDKDGVGDLKNPNIDAAVWANKVYLEFPTTEDSEPANDDEVKTPTEAADGANDPDSGDDMSAGETDNTPAEKNPETGIALAIVPMLVAAAAAVVSKKH